MANQAEQNQFKRYMTLFSQESDRACVILTVSMIDSLLRSILKTRLVPQHSSQDTLFDGATAPFSTLSAKIDVSHRIGILSSQLCRDIHLLRKIRNEFAHNIEGCDFQNAKVQDRIKELTKSFAQLIEAYKEDSKPFNYAKGKKGDFQFCSSWIIDYLDEYIESIHSIDPSNLEWAYNKQDIMIRKSA